MNPEDREIPDRVPGNGLREKLLVQRHAPLHRLRVGPVEPRRLGYSGQAAFMLVRNRLTSLRRVSTSPLIRCEAPLTRVAIWPASAAA